MAQALPFRQHASHVIYDADAFAVRRGLESLFAQEPLRCLPGDLRSAAEIVMAEALNNIVEHAYAAGAGWIEITVEFRDEGLDCTITDRGAPMPSGQLPQGKAQDLSVRENLPESGFGWFLIRSLAEDLQYSRFCNQNFLRFRLPTQAMVA